mmetsp:Transcript_28767/g.72248  ORF Transcript_28767/g.72248 Transcript_28767/m.72248 type:complete len:269 (-) Transcript_28767:43-849(-)
MCRWSSTATASTTLPWCASSWRSSRAWNWMPRCALRTGASPAASMRGASSPMASRQATAWRIPLAFTTWPAPSTSASSAHRWPEERWHCAQWAMPRRKHMRVRTRGLSPAVMLTSVCPTRTVHWATTCPLRAALMMSHQWTPMCTSAWMRTASTARSSPGRTWAALARSTRPQRVTTSERRSAKQAWRTHSSCRTSSATRSSPTAAAKRPGCAWATNSTRDRVASEGPRPPLAQRARAAPEASTHLKYFSEWLVTRARRFSRSTAAVP